MPATGSLNSNFQMSSNSFSLASALQIGGKDFNKKNKVKI
jgi:hypothetical protein